MANIMNERQRQCYAEGFAHGLSKCASAGKALPALENAIRVVVNPHSERTMAAIGHDIYDAFSHTNPVKSFLWSRMARPGQLGAIQSAMNAWEQALSKVPAGERAAREAERDAFMNRQFAELGAGAEKKIRFVNTAVPAAAGVGLTMPLAYAGGHIVGQNQQNEQDVDALANMPIHKRLQYALFPQTMLPQRPPKQPYE